MIDGAVEFMDKDHSCSLDFNLAEVFCLCVLCGCMSSCVLLTCRYPHRSEGIGFPRTGVTVSCKPLDVGSWN